MKLLYLPLLIILFMVPAISFADPIDDVASLIRKGNISELSKLFAPSVEIAILNNENTYSKAQAQVTLDKFFSEHKPATVTILHKIKSNANYLFGVLIVNSGKETFRVAFTLKGTQGNLMLIEFRVETEKLK